ncbi:hypothetical protein [Streptomyces sp. fd1-xmd]|uniref:hypothetical protein n=1 Tax=Streptomyces sp. fd1-xmd TaxID=1812480 RepID=UPI000D1CCD74|nr:hypothetical protein [Streptomyces sp. fd1-xmd]
MSDSMPVSVSVPGSAADTAALPFPTGWCATDLGNFRPCASTYEVYSLESLPPLEAAHLDGGFDWLGGAGGPRSGHTEHLAATERDLAEAGLTLPEGFAAFYGSESLCRVFDEVSVTACWSHLSGPLRSPVEEGARLVRFLRDQQDCVIWYLYLRPSGEAFVVFSHLELESAGWWADGEPTEEVRAAVASSLMRCADTFEEFAYRFVVENELWMQAHSAGAAGPLAHHLRTYADHYASAAS